MRDRARRLLVPLTWFLAGLSATACSNFPSPHIETLGASPDPGQPLQITFTPKVTSGHGHILYSWDFGDGNAGSCRECSGAPTTHNYQSRGHYYVVLTVTDENLTTTRAGEEVVAGNQLPTAVLTAPAIVLVEERLLLDGSASSDADGTVTRWDFWEDSSSEEIPADAQFRTADKRLAWSYLKEGTYYPRVRVYDNDGAAAVTGRMVRIQVVQKLPSPEVWVTSPGQGDTVRGTITLRAETGGRGTVTQIEFYLDGGRLPGPNGASLDWDSTTTSDGPHSIASRAYNSQNGVGQSDAISIVVSNHSPGL